MPWPTDWRYFDSRSGLANGYFPTALDSALAGHGYLLLDSLATDADGIAVGTKSVGHSYRKYQVLEIAGATPDWLNGLHRVIGVTSTTFSFVPENTEANTTATGTLSAKVAPLPGWSLAFSSASYKVYTNGWLFLRVPISTYERVDVYSAMSDVNTGTLMISPVVPCRFLNARSDRAQPQALLVGDANTLVFGSSGYSSEYYVNIPHYVGAFNDLAAPGGSQRCALMGFQSADTSLGSSEHYFCDYASASTTTERGLWTSQAGGTANAYPCLPGVDAGVSSGAFDASPVTGNYVISPVILKEQGPTIKDVTGSLRGLGFVFNTDYSTDTIERIQEYTVAGIPQAWRICRTYGAAGLTPYALRLM